MILSQRRVTIELGRGCTRHIIRRVYDAHATGIEHFSWVGRKYFQWKGWIKLLGAKQPVWGYTENSNPPEEWSNDTY